MLEFYSNHNDNHSLSNEMDDHLCDLCKLTGSKYICPQCGAAYCSVDCFGSEKHSTCNEVFYEKCVKEEMQLLKCDENSKKRMTEILNRTLRDPEDLLDSDDDDDVDDEIDLAKRMENVNLDNVDEVWEKLNSREREDFKRLIGNGDIIKLLPEWQPWWIFFSKKILVQDISGNIAEKHSCPNINVDIRHITQLTKIKPSENIPFMLCNILMSYACTARWFRGNHGDLPVDAAVTLLALSATLRNNEIFNNLPASYAAFQSDFINSRWMKKDNIDSDTICNDLRDIVNGENNNDKHFSVKVCLSDIHDVLQKALKEQKPTPVLCTTRKSGKVPTSSEIKKLCKKIIYYLSWTCSFGEKLDDLVIQL